VQGCEISIQTTQARKEARVSTATADSRRRALRRTRQRPSVSSAGQNRQDCSSLPRDQGCGTTQGLVAARYSVPATANGRLGTYSAVATAPSNTWVISGGGIHSHAATTVRPATSREAGRIRRARLA